MSVPFKARRCMGQGQPVVRVMCVLQLVLALATASATGALAQARSYGDLIKPDNADAAAQQEFVRKLKKFAAGEAPNERSPQAPEYWAIIRANLARKKSALAQGGERSLAGGPADFRLPDADDMTAMNGETTAALAAYLVKIEAGERIFGGTPARRGEFDQVVSIALHQQGTAFKSFCSGTVIAPKLVLTAAHCICEPEFGEEDKARRPAVVLATDVNRPETIQAAFAVERAFSRDPEFCARYADDKTVVVGRDVAAIFFDPDAPLHGKRSVGGIKPAPIATWEMLFAVGVEDVDLVGFGFTPSGALGEKRFTTTAVADRICSPDAVQKFRCALGREIVVIDAELKRDTCDGDSGGPAFMRDRSENIFLIGVTSRGALGQAPCGTGGIYSLITPDILHWLTVTLGETEIATCVSPTRCLRLQPK